MCNCVGRYQTLLCLFISIHEISIVYIQECKLVKIYVFFLYMWSINWMYIWKFCKLWFSIGSLFERVWWWFIKKATWKARGNTIHTPWQEKRNNSCHPHAVTQHLRQVVSLTLTGSKVFLGFWNVTVFLCFWIKELWQI